MTPKELQDRTKQFALDAMALARELPTSLDGRRVGGQLIDSATAVAANYRAACRARSRAEFAARIGVVLEESDESLFWLELIGEAALAPRPRIARLLKEAFELTAIFAATRKTVTARR
ncbi:MAG: four helix bundle protein [Vicinamibacterales bacterium]